MEGWESGHLRMCCIAFKDSLGSRVMKWQVVVQCAEICVAVLFYIDGLRHQNKKKFIPASTAVTRFLASAFPVISKMLEKSEKSENRKIRLLAFFLNFTLINLASAI